MNLSNKEFEEKLSQGNDFEVDVVQPFLLEQFPDYWLESTHDYRTGDYAGPKLYNKTRRPLIMPDFRLTNVNKSCKIILFEAKHKTQPFSIAGHRGCDFVSIEEFKCMQYEEAANVVGATLQYIIGVESTKSLHIVKPCDYVPHSFNNQYSKGVVRAFYVNDFNKVGKLE